MLWHLVVFKIFIGIGCVALVEGIFLARLGFPDTAGYTVLTCHLISSRIDNTNTVIPLCGETEFVSGCLE